MTILTILRHAKSDWGDPQLDDFDRPLNDRGRKAAKAIGDELKDRRVKFDLVFASPAVRVRETLDRVEGGYGKAFDVRFDQNLYGASLAALVDFVRAIPEQVHAPLLVGHNPGLQQLVLALTRDEDQKLRKSVEAKFPTAAVAIIELPAVRWDEVETGSGEIVELILPRDLKD
jgi:phosphohistidine phosphatase